MNNILKVLVLICSVLILAAAATADTAGMPRISLVEGDVLLNTAETGEWVPAALNTPLHEGDSLWCPADSRAEIQLQNGSWIRLDHGTQLEFLARDSGFLQLHLVRGRLFVRTSASKEQNLQIDADDTTVLPAARTRLRIDMKDNSEEDVSIFKGAAYVEGGGSRTRIRAGEQIALENGRSELLPLNAPDEWEQWNSQRDRRVASASRSEAYLPDELKPYGPELDTGGTWIEVEEYGMVWRPAVASDWAPYRIGRWVWLRGDYVWVSYESWGWAPHHYGRWISHPSRGWFWVPPSRGDVYWSPGYVGWFSYSGSIGWVPLAPGETYYGYGTYGRFSINVTAPGTQGIVIGTNYMNTRHGWHSATIIHQNDFLKGKTVIHQVPRTAPPQSAAIAGRPGIRPERETRMPIIKTVRHPLPDPPSKPVRETRERFPRVTPQATPPAQQMQPRQPNTVPQSRTAPPVTSAPAQQPDSSTPPLLQQREKRTSFPVQPQVQRERKVWHLKSREEQSGEQREKNEQREHKEQRERNREERKR